MNSRETSSEAIFPLASSVVWQKSRKTSESVSLKMSLRSKKAGSEASSGDLSISTWTRPKRAEAPGVLLALFVLERNQTRFRENHRLPDENRVESIRLAQNLDHPHVGRIAAHDLASPAVQLDLGEGSRGSRDPRPNRLPTDSANRNDEEFLIRFPASAMVSLAGRLQKIELSNTVDFVGGHRGSPLEQGRSRIVDAVVKENEIGTIPRLELTHECDQLLSVHITDLRQVPDLGANASLVQSAGDQRGNRLIVPGTDNPRARNRRA